MKYGCNTIDVIRLASYININIMIYFICYHVIFCYVIFWHVGLLISI